jgi:hypothetical protein
MMMLDAVLLAWDVWLLVVPQSAETDVLAQWIKDAGGVAASLAAIGGVAWFTVKQVLGRIQSMIDDATEPLKKNGGASVGDVPARIDGMQEQIDRMEDRQKGMDERLALIQSVVMERRSEHRATDSLGER